MTGLDIWLKQATRCLSTDSVTQVECEIREHYESAREAAMTMPGGATMNDAEADRLAVAALGDPKAANRQYRKVFLTSVEAKMLREGNWEARAVCSRAWLRWLLLALPAAALWGSAALVLTGSRELARTLLVGGMTMLVVLGVPFLPVYTPARARVFRRVKWLMFLATFALVFGKDLLGWSWLLAACVWPIFWVEWTRISIRRKLPAAQWPKQLYL